jgi:hypothetical protein
VSFMKHMYTTSSFLISWSAIVAKSTSSRFYTYKIDRQVQREAGKGERKGKAITNDDEWGEEGTVSLFHQKKSDRGAYACPRVRIYAPCR